MNLGYLSGTSLEVLLGKREVNVGTAGCHSRVFNGASKYIRLKSAMSPELWEDNSNVTHTTEISTDGRLELRLASRQVLSVFDRRPQAQVDALPVRTTEHGTSTKKSQWVVLGTSVVNGDVPEHIFANLLGEIDVDTQEIGLETMSGTAGKALN